MGMTQNEARKALEVLGLSQIELGRRMSAITGNIYRPQTVNAWFSGSRGPSDACVIYLTLMLEHRATE